MKNTLFLMLGFILLLLPLANAANTLVEKFETGTDNANFNYGLHWCHAQGFKITGNQSTYYVKNFSVEMGAFIGTPALEFAMIVNDNSGNPNVSGVVLNATTFAIAQNQFNFYTNPTMVALSNNTQYHIVVRMTSSTGDNTNKWQGKDEISGTYPNGQWKESSDCNAWNNVGSYDWNFRIYAEDTGGIFPNISSINCTSAGYNGDSIPPYSTADTTPTFSFNTNTSANCRIGGTKLNYSAMSSSRNCLTGEGTQIHKCTLTSQDELTLPTSYVYLACVNTFNNSLESNATLLMDITNLEVNGSLMIQMGVQTSAIWPGATVYDSQKIYLRNLANQQLLTTVDKVIVFGNQRWLINYGNVSLGLFNLTPVVYTLELVNAPLTQIPGIVSAFINSTKR